MEKLFLCHYSGDATDVEDLALALRLHGIVPWMDKQGGFLIADDCELEARRAISKDCFGLLIYATEEVFTRPFVKNVEVDEAKKVFLDRPAFAIFAVPRRIGFDKLRGLGEQHFGFDLSRFHTVEIPNGGSPADAHMKIAALVAAKRVKESLNESGSFCLQYSTRELMPHQPGDVLSIDGRALFRATAANSEGWARLLDSLSHIKTEISQYHGRPRLQMHGSKHLAAAFLFGRVFAPFEMDIRQTPTEVWSTDCNPSRHLPFRVAYRHEPSTDQRLFLEIATGYKNIERGVNELLSRTGIHPSVRLQLAPISDPPHRLDNSLCRTAVVQTYDLLERTLQAHCISEIHLFAAAPQSFMMMLGREFKGTPPVYLYEWENQAYVQTCYLPSGIL